MTVSERFDKFLSNITITNDQEKDGITKHTGVRTCLNKHYYGSTDGHANSMLVGSWGKKTRVRPPRDIDVLFRLPNEIYNRFQLRPGNKQSQLLQEVKEVLANTYSTTKISGDGQIVFVAFESYAVEVVPAFMLINNNYWICDTNSGGSYKETAPDAEAKAIADSDRQYNGNTRHLIRMLKKWQEYCNVALKSFTLELLAIQFIGVWQYQGKSSTYYDWMVRDFFEYLIGKGDYGYVTVPGTNEVIWLGSDWKSKAESARDRAVKACKYEADTNSTTRDLDAWYEWKCIFGDDVPYLS